MLSGERDGRERCETELGGRSLRSIKTKLFAIIAVTVLVVFLMLAGVGAYYIQRVTEEDFTETMTMLAAQKSGEVDTHFRRMERAVEILGQYVEQNVDTEKFKNDLLYRNAILKEIEKYGEEAAKITGNVATYYFRPDPTIYGSTTGVFERDNGEGGYVSEQLTDILKYDPADREHVGWYYEPVNSGKAIWMRPYANKNIDVYMISYVAPVYVGGELFGVVGMDINMSAIYNVVDSVNYAKGFGLLLGEDGTLLYHRDYPEGLKASLFDEELKEAAQYFAPEKATGTEVYQYIWKEEKQRLIAKKLQNNMVFAISVPEAEIMKTRTDMWRNMFGILVLVVIAVLIVTRVVMLKIVEPIRELTQASTRIAKGEMNVPIRYQSKDELGELAGSIRLMAKEIREYIAYIHAQAYIDGMTGVGNKTAYMDVMKQLDRKIQEGLAEFVVVVFDVNGLKTVNDNLGHECGDRIITGAANALKKSFGAEHTYRIGGDEFIVVLENVADVNLEECYRDFDRAVAEENKKIAGEKLAPEDAPAKLHLAVSKGAAAFEPKQDKEYKEVFRRADEEMYRDKERFYQGKNDRRRR